ncbi:MAG: 1,4-alpha-glucan branching protein GlgB [Bacteroidales bacterium]|nr:1,4-alpha-glucan branching protein GlgB [Bacteroidales bacterium]MCF8343182.1 1,4-alpha-glucan branching protein GlgB [Bacteroidales bacterium]MCF8377265.1 1,4-alpha-glucan branching protein GlgB [Bacteroidales bacterium]MCF8401113.1 1,4-alpha-glucan branching protein GlgB [Bacteroidales bacterium]
MAKKKENTTYKLRVDPGVWKELDEYLFKEGNHYLLYKILGSTPMELNGKKGTYFAVWAPNANKVSVMGNFNNWSKNSHPLKLRIDSSGVWEGFITDVKKGDLYKYFIKNDKSNFRQEKADPFAGYAEIAPQTASVVWKSEYKWKDDNWMKKRIKNNALDAPISTYEVHAGSWRRKPEEGNDYLNYRELAHELVDYLKDTGFTHVEFLPLAEHPFTGSWGYQVLGYFAPTSRFGTPDDFKYMIDYLHQHDIGVIMDWVPSHFPADAHGLYHFDGTHLFEHSDPRQGFHPDWQSYIFNLGRNEVREFLLSSAHFWLDEFHIDGLRVDAVASMLYLDYSRKEGEWIPNKYGGRENLESISFLRQLNESIYERFPDVQTIAEESTAWPMVSRPTYLGGLGFGMKWNMGWMHDSLSYFSKDPVYRKYEHNKLTFGLWYAFNENFVLSISHDEVVHGKGSMISKMPGDNWQKFANLRLLFGFMWTHPGKKLLFMGSEFGQWSEWNHDSSLDWHLLDTEIHNRLKYWISDLNTIYKKEKPLFELDFQPEGFEWIEPNDAENSVLTFMRKGKKENDQLLIVCNFTPVVRHNFRVGIPESKTYREVLNSDAKEYGGSGQGNFGKIQPAPVPMHGQFHSLNLTLPPLSILILKPED